jgi:hypothetical protein
MGSSASFGVANAFSNALALVTNPATFMKNNKDAALSVKTILVNYVAILALVPLLAVFIGDLWYYSIYGLAGYVLISAILTYILDILAVFAIGFVIWKLGPSFGTQATQEKSTLLAAFLYTPVFLASILNIIPFLGIVSILGLLYGLYILYLGLPIIFDTPQDKVITYVVATVVVSFIVFYLVSAIVGAVSVAIFLHAYLPFY